MANFKNEFASNNVDLRSILDTVNNLPVHENIDAELDTQDDLIAQIAGALEGKVAGSGGSTPGGTISITENGTYDVTAYASADVNVPSDKPVLQNKTITPGASNQTVTADSGYDGLGTVTVQGDTNLVSEKIAEGWSIFGVTGSMVAQSRIVEGNVTVSNNTQTIRINTGIIVRALFIVNKTYGDCGYYTQNGSFFINPYDEAYGTLTVTNSGGVTTVKISGDPTFYEGDKFYYIAVE